MNLIGQVEAFQPGIDDWERRLADKCSYGAHLEEALRDRFVCGLQGAAIQRKLLAIDGLTLKTAYETAYGMEAADRRASQLQLQGPGSRATADATINVVDNHGSACYRCGKTNHSQESCFYRKQKCRAYNLVTRLDLDLAH